MNRLFISILLMVILGGCSDLPAPENLEPSIAVEHATDVTRTQATLTAVVASHGTGRISSLRFHYGLTPEMTEQSALIDVTGDTIRWRADNLIPGHEYYFSATGGNGTASLTSQTLTFSTEHNDPPSVSEARLLSYGPMSMVIEFEITSDGGFPITSAGCDVTDNATGSRVRHFIEPAPVEVGVHHMFIHVSSDASYSVTPFAANVEGETTGGSVTFTPQKAFMLKSPGLLAQLVGEDGFAADYITIAGEMNGDDFHFLRRMLDAPPLAGEAPLPHFISGADLTDVEIVEGGGPYDGSRYIIPGVISTGLFADCAKLTRIALPASATAIQSEAFQNCGAMETLDVPAQVATLSTSSGCIMLREINVSAANPLYKSEEGVLYDHDVTQILWFPMGRVGNFTIPPTVTSIGVETFRGCSLTSLTFSDSMIEIGRGALAESNFEEITMPDNLTNVAEAMFQNSPRLTCVRLGSATEYVGSYAFSGCPLRNLFVMAVFPPYVKEDAFDAALFDTCKLHVPQGSAAIYRNHAVWGKFKYVTTSTAVD